MVQVSIRATTDSFILIVLSDQHLSLMFHFLPQWSWALDRERRPLKGLWILMKIKIFTHSNRMKGKQLASNLAERGRKNSFWENLGAAHKGIVRCLNGTTISLPIIESKFEANNYLTYHTYVTTEVESRPFTRTELQQIRFCTKRRKGCILWILLMGKGSWYSNVNLRRNKGSKRDSRKFTSIWRSGTKFRYSQRGHPPFIGLDNRFMETGFFPYLV